MCTIHQNVKLLIQSIKHLELSDTCTFIQSYQECILLPSCYLGSCKNCPGFAGLEELFQTMLDENMIDNITFKQWVSVDRSTLDTVSKSADEFIEFFCEKLKQLLPHSPP